MDWQTAFNLVAGACGVLMGVILRETWAALSAMRNDLQVLQRSISETYVRRDDYREFSRQVLDKLDAIADKLDHKVDK